MLFQHRRTEGRVAEDEDAILGQDARHLDEVSGEGDDLVRDPPVVEVLPGHPPVLRADDDRVAVRLERAPRLLDEGEPARPER